MDEFENLLLLYPGVEYVDTAFIVQYEEDKKFDVRLYDEINLCSDEPLEKCGFETWEDAQAYIEKLYDEHPEVYFNRLFDLDQFVE